MGLLCILQCTGYAYRLRMSRISYVFQMAIGTYVQATDSRPRSALAVTGTSGAVDTYLRPNSDVLIPSRHLPQMNYISLMSYQEKSEELLLNSS